MAQPEIRVLEHLMPVNGLVAHSRRSFHEALGGAPPPERQIRIAGSGIRLRFATEALARAMSAAFAHIVEEAAGEPDLTIHIWDSQTRASSPPPLPTFERDEVWLLKTATLQAYTTAPGRFFHLLDFQSRLGYTWLNNTELSQPDVSSPLIPILHWWLFERGWAFLHAAAVGTPDLGAALLAGRGGRGKSSTALACLGSRLRVLGDDYCLARGDGRLHTLYCSAKVDDTSLKLLGFLEAARSPFSGPDWEKHMFFLHPGFASGLAAELEAKCVLIPEVAQRRDTAVVAARPGEALTALAPSTLYQLRFTREPAGMLAVMRTLVERLPCYRLLLGEDRSQIPAVIEEVIRQCG
jgi:hypothetical protein